MDPLHPYLARVRAFAQKERLFRRVKRVLVGVSGGADSVAAALVLQRLGAESGFDVVACHFDHKLREGSAEEQKRVRALCEGLGLSCITGEGDVRAMAEDLRLGVEEAGRRMRYQFLGFAAGKEQADVVATGHTADDQAETVLHHIIRGSGVRGIRGILPRSPLPSAEAQMLIRPVLCLERADTVAICRAAEVEFLEDPSNSELEYTRNRIRHEALPALAQLNPGIRGALVRLAGSAREAFEDIERAAMATQPRSRGKLGAIFDVRQLRELPTEALAMVIEREAAAAQIGYEVNATRLHNLGRVLSAGAGEVRVGEVEVEVSNKQVRVGPVLEDRPPLEPVVLNVPGVTRAGRWRIEIAAESRPGWQAIGDPTGVLRARGMLAGDRVRRMDRDVRLARLLADAGYPGWELRGLLVVADAEAVVAVPTLEVSSLREPLDPALWVRAVPIEG